MITDDSRKVKKGDTFVAIAGQHFDGNNFIKEAIAKGASVIVSEKKIKENFPRDVKFVKVDNVRKTLSEMASEYYKNPSSKLTVIGVTGSDGKTTTSHMIYEILKFAGKKVGLISSITSPGLHVTSPEPLELQKLLAKMVRAGLKYVVLETTSHAIDQHRISGIKFDIAVLTNVTHEHIDYHKTFEAYRNTKLKLFLEAKTSVLNKDDKNYSFFNKSIHGEKLTYSLKNNDLNVDKLMGDNIEKVGEYNIQNALAASAAARKLGISMKHIRLALHKMSRPKGRLDEIKNQKDLNLIIDFAHTPNALKQVLKLLKKRKTAKLIVVFGCAGERDVLKRPMMANIATSLADISVFTAEDPRHEKVEDIFLEMEKGIKNKNTKYYEISERGEAISFAINELAKKDDTVLITGKAHENSMAYNGVEYPWSDYKAVEYALKGKALKIKK